MALSHSDTHVGNCFMYFDDEQNAFLSKRKLLKEGTFHDDDSQTLENADAEELYA